MLPDQTGTRRSNSVNAIGPAQTPKPDRKYASLRAPVRHQIAAHEGVVAVPLSRRSDTNEGAALCLVTKNGIGTFA